jgi:hypothetical protein
MCDARQGQHCTGCAALTGGAPRARVHARGWEGLHGSVAGWCRVAQLPCCRPPAAEQLMPDRPMLLMPADLALQVHRKPGGTRTGAVGTGTWRGSTLRTSTERRGALQHMLPRLRGQLSTLVPGGASGGGSSTVDVAFCSIAFAK